VIITPVIKAISAQLLTVLTHKHCVN